jgi:hypothetical protein
MENEVKSIKPEVGRIPLVAKQVEAMKTIVEETNA